MGQLGGLHLNTSLFDLCLSTQTSQTVTHGHLTGRTGWIWRPRCGPPTLPRASNARSFPGALHSNLRRCRTNWLGVNWSLKCHCRDRDGFYWHVLWSNGCKGLPRSLCQGWLPGPDNRPSRGGYWCTRHSPVARNTWELIPWRYRGQGRRWGLCYRTRGHAVLFM